MKQQRREFRGYTLISTLIVIAIICVLAAIYIPHLIGGKDPLSGKQVASPKDRAKATVGVVYTDQINSAIQMYRMDNDNKNPENLAELKKYGVTDEMMLDPVTHRQLAYDPTSGRVGNSNGPDSLGGGANLPQVLR